jgi:uncharacterized membrane protein HdeD (DUF308 family)
MKIWKLVSGIISIVLFALVMFQSCAAGVYNTMEANGEASGTVGVIVAILLLCGGIVSIVVRNSDKKGGDIALIILFGLAALLGIACAGSYGDLIIWGIWCLINAVLALVDMLHKRKAIKQ